MNKEETIKITLGTLAILVLIPIVLAIMALCVTGFISWVTTLPFWNTPIGGTTLAAWGICSILVCTYVMIRELNV